jgi:hypothetical protein
LYVGCAGKTRAPEVVFQPLLSPALDVDKLAPPMDTKKPTVAPDALDYDDQPVPAKNACGLPMGVLVSETAYVQITADQSELKRRQVEVEQYRAVRVVERTNCEEVYQAQAKRILYLDAKLAEPPSWWDRHKFEIGVFTGVGLTVGAGYAVGQAAR